MKLALSRVSQAALEPILPKDVDVIWFNGTQEALTAVQGAEIGLIDVFEPGNDPDAVVRAGEDLKWVMTSMAGIGNFPLDLMARRSIIFTNGAGINANAVAEWAVMGVLALAKGLHQVISAHDREYWSPRDFGATQVAGSTVLVVGYGHIGKTIGARLEGLGAKVVGVRRGNPGPGEIGSSDWRGRLGEFDFVILAAPATSETSHMIGAAELRAMKPGAGLINIARGALIDQEALVEAVRSKSIGGAFLDVTDPEPLPPGHDLWHTPGITVTAHLAGRSQTGMADRTAALFVENLKRYRAGERLLNVVDTALGY